MRFKSWLENVADPDATPNSAEVIRSGQQPQVDGGETRAQQHHNNQKTLDVCFAKLKHVLGNMDADDRQAKFLRTVLDRWEELRDNRQKTSGPLGDRTFPRVELDYMGRNQPPPNTHQLGGVGILGTM